MSNVHNTQHTAQTHTHTHSHGSWPPVTYFNKAHLDITPVSHSATEILALFFGDPAGEMHIFYITRLIYVQKYFPKPSWRCRQRAMLRSACRISNKEKKTAVIDGTVLERGMFDQDRLLQQYEYQPNLYANTFQSVILYMYWAWHTWVFSGESSLRKLLHTGTWVSGWVSIGFRI